MKSRALIVMLMSGAALLLLKRNTSSIGDAWVSAAGDGGADPQQEGIMDAAQTALDQVIGTVTSSGDIADMQTSQNMLDMLKRRERLVLAPYNLGDGGWTIGYGHFAKSRAALPDSITPAQAETMFAQDVADRAEKWVKLYVTVPLTQYQFDALVSIAFNMSPQSFKKFAAEVNAGNGIDAIAQQSVAWVAPQFTNGIQNRRDAELDVYNNGVYA